MALNEVNPSHQRALTYNPPVNWMIRTAYRLASKANYVGYTTLVIGFGAFALSQMKQLKGTKVALALLAIGVPLSALALSILWGKRCLDRLNAQVDTLEGQFDALTRQEEHRQALHLARNAETSLAKTGIRTEFESTIRRLENDLLLKGPRPYYFDHDDIPHEDTLRLESMIRRFENESLVKEPNQGKKAYYEDLLGDMLRVPEHKAHSLAQFNTAFQKNFSKPSEENIAKWSASCDFQEIFTNLGMVEMVEPSFNSYAGVIVHAAPLHQMREQLNFIINQWKKGIRFESITFFAQEDRKAEIQFLWEEAKAKETFPEDLKAIQRNIYSDDTFQNQLETLPESNLPYLFVTGAPFIPLQDLINRKTIPFVKMEAVGPKMPEAKTAVYLEQIAGYIRVRVEGLQTLKV